MSKIKNVLYDIGRSYEVVLQVVDVDYTGGKRCITFEDSNKTILYWNIPNYTLGTYNYRNVGLYSFEVIDIIDSNVYIKNAKFLQDVHNSIK